MEGGRLFGILGLARKSGSRVSEALPFWLPRAIGWPPLLRALLPIKCTVVLRK